MGNSRPYLPRSVLVAVLGVAAAAGPAQAGEIYKSIDADGKVVYSDHLDPSLSQSSLVQLEGARLPPDQVHVCWTNCFTLILDNGVYRRADGTAETWTVETFSPDAIVLHRHDAPADWNGYSEDVIYAGRVSNDRLVGATVNGKPTGGIDASWGAALNTLPGSNAERDANSGGNLDPASIASVTSAATPPPLPEEDQPPLAEDGLLWTPGYWYFRDRAYVWIPGVWARPPRVGDLWTPGYWSVAGAVYVFHPGHWGSTIGFYGGVNYGCGYFGNGYAGGHWIGSSFAYNTAVNHVNGAVAHHTYAQPVPGQAQRGARSHTATPRSADSNHTVSPHRSPPAAVNKTTNGRAVEQAGETTPIPARVESPAANANTRSARAMPKSSSVTASRAAPIK